MLVPTSKTNFKTMCIPSLQRINDTTDLEEIGSFFDSYILVSTQYQKKI